MYYLVQYYNDLKYVLRNDPNQRNSSSQADYHEERFRNARHRHFQTVALIVNIIFAQDTVGIQTYFIRHR